MTDPVIHPEVTATNLLDQLSVSSEHDDVCRIALEAASSPVLWIAHWTQIVFSAACVGLIYDTVRAKKKRAFHANFLILTATYCIIEALFGIFTVITTLVSQFRYWTLSDPCDLASTTVLVFLLRLPRHIYVIAISYLAVSGCIERAIAVMRVDIYEELHFGVGIVLAVAPCMFCVTTVAYIVVDAALDERAPFAPFNGSIFTSNTSVIYTCLIMVNIGAAAINIFLWYINKQLFKRKIENYKLSKSYQMSENQAVMFAMIRGAIAHSAGLILVIAARLLIAKVRFEERNDSIVATEGGYSVTSLPCR
ncbi:hypothetical protein AAVH_14226 [Aphelenchoides avenae]|nr:hypothetical protein AAVH_14226 [Aphelenchus avenae]